MQFLFESFSAKMCNIYLSFVENLFLVWKFVLSRLYPVWTLGAWVLREVVRLLQLFKVWKARFSKYGKLGGIWNLSSLLHHCNHSGAYIKELHCNLYQKPLFLVPHEKCHECCLCWNVNTTYMTVLSKLKSSYSVVYFPEAQPKAGEESDKPRSTDSAIFLTIAWSTFTVVPGSGIVFEEQLPLLPQNFALLISATF